MLFRSVSQSRYGCVGVGVTVGVTLVLGVLVGVTVGVIEVLGVL